MAYFDSMRSIYGPANCAFTCLVGIGLWCSVKILNYWMCVYIFCITTFLWTSSDIVIEIS